MKHEQLRDLKDIGRVEKRGIYKSALCKSNAHYFRVQDYMQKINYCIQDLNSEIMLPDVLSNKSIVYIITVVTWLREAIRGLKSLYNEKALETFVYFQEQELQKATNYLLALRSFVVAHPLDTCKHSAYGMDGTLTCIDIRQPGEYLSLVPEYGFAHLDYEGLHMNTRKEADFYLYAFSTRVEKKDLSIHIGCSLQDIYHVAALYIDKLYALDRHLQKQRKT